MNSDYLKRNLSTLTFQRNIFLSLTIILSLSLMVLSIFIFQKSERIIITPPTIDKEFWVETNQVSPTYMEQFALFLGQLMLTKSPQSAASQRTVVLRHVDPSFYGEINKKLSEEEKKLTKQQASYVFYPTDIRVDTQNFQVKLTGDRTFYIGGKSMSTSREIYKLSFLYAGGRMLLKEISSEE